MSTLLNSKVKGTVPILRLRLAPSVNLGQSPIIIDGITIIIKGIKEGSILSYRYDPGITFLWIGGILVMTGMWIKTFIVIFYRIFQISEK